jgi:hypothetical protein
VAAIAAGHGLPVMCVPATISRSTLAHDIIDITR